MQQLISNSEVKYPISLIILSILIMIIPLIIVLVVAVVYDVSMFETMVIGIALGILLRIIGVRSIYFPKHLIVTDYYIDIHLDKGRVKRLYTKEISRITETPSFSILFFKKSLFFEQYILTPKAGATLLEILNGLKHKVKHIPLKE